MKWEGKWVEASLLTEIHDQICHQSCCFKKMLLFPLEVERCNGVSLCVCMYRKEEEKKRAEEYKENPPSAERRGGLLRIVVFTGVILSPGNSQQIPI